MKYKILLGARNSEMTKTFVQSLENNLSNDSILQVQYLMLSIRKLLSEQRWDFLLLMDNFDETFPLTTDALNKIKLEYPEVRLLLLIDKSRKGTKFLNELLNIPVYDVLFYEDAKMDAVLHLLNSPRTKAEAVDYLETETTRGGESEFSISDLIEYLDKLSIDQVSSAYDYCLTNLKAEHRVVFNENLSSPVSDHLKEIQNVNYIAYLKSIEGKRKKKSIQLPTFSLSKEKRVQENEIDEDERDHGELQSGAKVVEKTRTTIVNTQHSVIRSEMPNDYKKLVVVTGLSDSGKSTITFEVLKTFKKSGLPISAIDLTKTSDLLNNFKVKEGEKSLSDLLLEINDPWLYDKSLAIYGAYDGLVRYSGLYDVISKLLFRENNLVVAEADYMDGKDYFEILSKADDILFVVSADPRSYREIHRLKNVLEAVNNEKITVVINKSCGSGIKKHRLRQRIYKETGQRLSAISSVPFSEDYQIAAWDGRVSYNSKSRFAGIDESLGALVKTIYPYDKRRK